jgi:hypothetical protein
MIINIEPFTVAFVGTKVDIQMPMFALGATEGYAYAQIMTADGRVVKSERVYIPPEVYAGWGEDDRYIVDYVMEQLNIIEAVE